MEHEEQRPETEQPQEQKPEAEQPKDSPQQAPLEPFIAAASDMFRRVGSLVSEGLGSLSAGGRGDTQNRLTKLKSLLDQGLITQEEYDRKRAAILEDL